MKELTLTIRHLGDRDEVVTATYLPHEEHAMRDWIAAAEKRGTPRATVERELEFVNLLKATFEAVLLPC